MYSFTSSYITSGFTNCGIYLLPEHYFLCSEVTNRPTSASRFTDDQQPSNSQVVKTSISKNNNSPTVISSEHMQPFPKATQRINVRKADNFEFN